MLLEGSWLLQNKQRKTRSAFLWHQDLEKNDSMVKKNIHQGFSICCTCVSHLTENSLIFQLAPYITNLQGTIQIGSKKRRKKAAYSKMLSACTGSGWQPGSTPVDGGVCLTKPHTVYLKIENGLLGPSLHHFWHAVLQCGIFPRNDISVYQAECFQFLQNGRK